MKTTEEMVAVMTAYKEGKTIEYKKHEGIPSDWTDNDTPSWNWALYDYRVKPEPKYRPYKNADECFRDAQKHGGWIDGVMCDHHKAMITYISNHCVYTSARITGRTEFEDLLNNFHWADDGSVCGVLEEDTK